MSVLFECTILYITLLWGAEGPPDIGNTNLWTKDAQQVKRKY